MRTLALILCATALGCGSTVSVGNDNPRGTVGGIIVDAETEMPISGAMITIVSASDTVTTTSDAMGVWQATKVPAGSFIITMASMGYVSAVFNATLGGNVGNFPVNNPALTIGPTGLVKNSGAFNVRLVDQGGAPAAGVKAVARTQVRYVDFSNAFPQAIGGFEVSNLSGADGVVHFTALPDYAGLGSSVNDTLFVDVAATKIMGTEVYNFLGITAQFSVNHLTDSTPTIVLAGPRTNLAVLTSNIDYLRTGVVTTVGSVVPVMGPITVTFNQAINPTSMHAIFQTDDGKTAPFAAMATVQGNVVSITPSAGFTPGMRYNLQLHTEAAQALLVAGGQYDAIAPFFAQQTTGVNPQTVTAKIDSMAALPTLVITLNEAIGLGGAQTGYVLPCVAFYENVNFDNDSTNAYQGEWPANATPAVLQCPSSPAPAVDVTRVTEVEGVGPFTGFSRTWRVQFDGAAMMPGPCSPLISSNCIHPAQGTKVHLVFSKQNTPGNTVHRVTGDAVGDDIVAIITP